MGDKNQVNMDNFETLPYDSAGAMAIEQDKECQWGCPFLSFLGPKTIKNGHLDIPMHP